MKRQCDVDAGTLLIVAPLGKDAELAINVLQENGIAARACASVREAAAQVDLGINALIIAEEALVTNEVPVLLDALAKQPPWSDLPLIILTSSGGEEASRRIATTFGTQTNATLLERPLHAVTLVSATRAALRARRRQYQVLDLLQQREAALAGVTDAFAALDRDWRYVYVNETAARYAGMRRDEMIGRKIWDIYPEAVGGTFYQHIMRAVETQRPQSFEQFYDRWNCWLETRVYPAGEAGVAVFRANINERKRQETLMREAERRMHENETVLRLALEAAGAGTFDYHADSREMRLGPRGKQLLGFDSNETPSLSEIIAIVHADDRNKALGALRNALHAGGQPIGIEFRVRRASDHAERWIAATGRALSESAGPAKRCVGTLLDVTERKRAEQSLKDAKSAAEEANRVKDKFLAMISHELRTPLTPVLMTINALQRDPAISDAVRADLDMIHRNIELEALIIDDLLDLTRVAHGKLQLHYDAADIHALLAHALSISASDIGAKQIGVIQDLGAAEHHSWADAARLQQVFWNLIKNAVKFTPSGGEVRISTRNDKEHHLIVEICDTGIGIEPELLPRIFDAFEQGGRSVTSEFGGMGLGLAISKTIVDLHGGSIAAESAGRNRGATFSVTLEAIATSLLDGPVYPLEHKQLSAAARILLVEDHADTARVLQRMLERAGYAVTCAPTIAQARQLAMTKQFDLVISDLGLPDGSGVELMRELNAKERIAGIALSGFGMEEDTAASRAAGFAEHLTKPVDWERLRAAIERVMKPERDLSPA